MTPEISMIIPVYGVEKYIEKCISSIINQSFTNFEAIIIDDGSLDQSIAIAKKISAHDSRFIFLSQENKGQGSARNLGIKNAKGKYLAFVDSDDYIETNYLEKLHETIIQNNSDVCVCDIHYVLPNGKKIKTFHSQPKQHIEKNDYLFCEYYLTPFMWDKLFKKEVFKTLRFNEKMRSDEDSELIYKLCYQKNISHIAEPLYYYVQHPLSATHTIKPNYLADRLFIINGKEQFCLAHETNSHPFYFTFCYLKTFVFFVSTKFARFSTQYQEDTKQLKMHIKPELFTLANIFKMIKYDKKVGISLLCFKISPRLYQYLVKKWFKRKQNIQQG